MEVNQFFFIFLLLKSKCCLVALTETFIVNVFFFTSRNKFHLIERVTTIHNLCFIQQKSFTLYFVHSPHFSASLQLQFCIKHNFNVHEDFNDSLQIILSFCSNISTKNVLRIVESTILSHVIPKSSALNLYLFSYRKIVNGITFFSVVIVSLQPYAHTQSVYFHISHETKLQIVVGNGYICCVSYGSCIAHSNAHAVLVVCSYICVKINLERSVQCERDNKTPISYSKYGGIFGFCFTPFTLHVIFVYKHNVCFGTSCIKSFWPLCTWRTMVFRLRSFDIFNSY